LKLSIEYAENAIKNKDIFKYFVLLILTDGEINDMESSICEIVKACELPISILIIGLGDNEFKSMEKLDGNVNALYSKKLERKVSRDIVQFIPFEKFKNNQK